MKHHERENRARICTYKAKFSLEEARARAAQENLWVYKCPICHEWHLTKKKVTGTWAGKNVEAK